VCECRRTRVKSTRGVRYEMNVGGRGEARQGAGDVVRFMSEDGLGGRRAKEEQRDINRRTERDTYLPL
jgi:hypothetical protein